MKYRLTLMTAGTLFVTACGGLSANSSTSASSPSSIAAAPQHATAATAPQSAFLTGNAHPQYPAGRQGQVSVVYQAPIQPQTVGTLVPVVFRNNTSATIAHVSVSSTAKDRAGKIVASGASQGTDPSVVKSGQWAFAFVYFQPGSALAADDTLSFTFQSMPASTEAFNTAAIRVTQANLSGSTIAGGVQNTTGNPVRGPISVHAYCLDSSGDPASVAIGFTSTLSSGLTSNATDSFQLNLTDQKCSSFLVGASGYYK